MFAGRRNPSRDRLLCICVGLGITLDETQRMLTQGGYAQLYPRTRRDAIISYGVVHQLPLGEINDKLFAEQEKPCFDRALGRICLCGKRTANIKTTKGRQKIKN